MNILQKVFFLILIIFPLIAVAQCPSSLYIESQADIDTFFMDYPNCEFLDGSILIDDSSDVVIDIVDLSQFSNVKSLGGHLIVKNCPLLPSLTGFNSIETIAGDFFIYNNAHVAFKTFLGFESLNHIGGKITIRYMDNLESFEGMGTIISDTIPEIKITDNPKLSSLAPLKGIKNVTGNVTLKRNLLLSMDGMDSLITVGGFFQVRNEEEIDDISQLLSLKTVGIEGDNNSLLFIWDNPKLKSLYGLDNIENVYGQISVFRNEVLGDCAAICDIINIDDYDLNLGENKDNSPCDHASDLITYCSSTYLSDSIFLSETTCDIESVGTDIQTLTNMAGYDSIVTTITTLLPVDTVTINKTTCDPDLAGTVTQNLTNVYGCDSMVVTITTLDMIEGVVSKTTEVLTASPDGLTYQWVDCSNGYSEIEGMTAIDFAPSQSGDYAVIISNSNCSDTTECISFIVGFEEIAFGRFSIYPNPTLDNITVKSNFNSNEISIKLTNSLGQVVIEQTKFSERFFTIPMEDLEEGLYFLHLMHDNKYLVSKIIKGRPPK